MPRILAILLGIGLSTPILFAQDGSPIQPEFVAPPVAPGPAVNQFTGDFTFGLPILTVPGPNGSGHSLTLSYRAGTNPNGEVGWVGYGWSLNPGAIVRNKRGFPDDWDGEVTIHAKQPTDFVFSREIVTSAEIGSGDLFDEELLKKSKLSGGASKTYRYDSRTGFGDIFGVTAGVSLLGSYAGVQFSCDNGDGSLAGILTPNLVGLAGLFTDNESGAPGSSSLVQAFLNQSRGRMMKYLQSPLSPSFVFGSRELEMGPPARVPMSGETANDGTKVAISFSPGVVLGYEHGGSTNLMTMDPASRTEIRALGYMHSASGEEDPDALMDFYYENDVPFLKDDEFLPIPFSNPDLFSVVGGGSFRLHNRGVGRFRTNEITSELDVYNTESAYNFGASNGFGIRYGAGTLGYDAGGWRTLDTTTKQNWLDSGDEPWFFRYIGDRGGTLLYDDDDEAVRPRLHEDAGLGEDILDFLRINDADRFATLLGDVGLQLEAWERPGRNGYIGYSTNAEMLVTRNNHPWQSYARDAATRDLVADRNEVPGLIGEFALYGTSNARHIYGLPVHARAERNMNIDLANIMLDSAERVQGYTIAHRWIEEYAAERLNGQEHDEPYATMWLLTEKRTPDYIDLTGDGPTNDDLGGWTRFHYTRHAGGEDKTSDRVSNWHRWRAPFNGLYFQAGKLSDPEDDMGSWSEGVREHYYLDKIETKTHYAVFVLNRQNLVNRRLDSYTPAHSIDDARLRGDTAATNAEYGNPNVPTHPNRNDARCLDRIELYVKGYNGRPDSLLSRTYFAYDYSLRPNMPNSVPVHPDSTTRHGMLTLRKVWTESLTVQEATIHPWIFGYDYRKSDDYSIPMKARYPQATGHADSFTPLIENPPYHRLDLDPWGYHRPSMVTQREHRRPWIDQNDSMLFDPAAWQLKWIRTPSGGEMHVQYEEDDYAFVHDRPVMVMARLRDSVGEGVVAVASDDQLSSDVFLDLGSFGVDSSDSYLVTRLYEQIRRTADREKKVFFKFLYALTGDSAQLRNPEWSSEYVEGYADVDKVVLDSHTVVPSGTYYSIKVKLAGYDDGNVHDHGVPKRICWDLVRKRRRGKLGPDDGIAWSPNRDLLEDELKRKYHDFEKNDYCKDIDYANSYLRIPLPGSKRGGGLRVKRVLTYDPGIEGDSALYGTEYRYEVYDEERRQVISSGVASNEPIAMRDENPLVAFMAREASERVEGKVIAGRDRPRNEGPIGETLLPSASVAYSRVVTHPIHQGASTSGFSVTDFYTFRDFPYDARYPGIGPAIDFTGSGNRDYETSPLFSNLIVYRQNEQLLYRSQGYRFVQTDMHGKPRRAFTNGGLYSPYEDDWMTSASLEYDYFLPGDSIPLMYRPGDTIRYGWPGKTMEIVHAHRRNGSYVDDFKAEVDAGLFYVSGLPYFMVRNTELNTYVSSKVVHYPAILRGVRSFADGNYEYRENVAFDPLTGSPSVVRTRDAFDGLVLDQSPGGHEGSYRSYRFPTRALHPSFAAVAENERGMITSSTGFVIQKGIAGGRAFLDFPGGSEGRWITKLAPGDLLHLTGTVPSIDLGVYHVDEIAADTVWLLASDLYNAPSDPSLSVVGQASLRVIRSGRINAPGATLGGVATYGTTDEDFAVGADFGWSGTGANERLAFVDQLNAAIGGGTSTLNSSNVSAGLSFVRRSDGACGTLGTLGLAFTLSTSNDTIFVAATSQPTDTLVHLDLGGHFDLDDAGQVVFRSRGNLPSIHRARTEPGPVLSVPNVRFCGDSTIYRTVANVIGASATLLDDEISWDETAGATGTPGLGNAYERGERGRWSSRTGYAYRTDVTTGSVPAADERIYKSAGVYDDFSLFNWSDPSASDMSRWRGVDSVTAIGRTNMPHESIDRLGRRNVTRFLEIRDDVRVAEQSAWNAADSTIDFTSFESDEVGDLGGKVDDAVAHAGRHSLRLLPDIYNGHYGYLADVKVTEQLQEKGAVLRAWVYPDTTGLLGWSPYYLGRTVPTVVARVGDWKLIEYVIDADSIETHFALGEIASFGFRTSGPDTIWIDDAKFQPLDAVSTAIVYDPVLLRPVATFDHDNFGIYPVYDGEGKMVRSIVETSRGRRTIGDAHSHVAGINRDWLGEGSPWVSSALIEGAPLSTGIGGLPDGRPEGTIFDVDVAGLHLSTENSRLEVFGMSPAELLEAVEGGVEDFDSLSSDQIRQIEAYEQLQIEHRELRARLDGAVDVEKNQIEAALLRKEEEGRSLLESIEESRKNGEEQE